MQMKIAQWGFAYQLVPPHEKTVHMRRWQEPAKKHMVGPVHKHCAPAVFKVLLP